MTPEMEHHHQDDSLAIRKNALRRIAHSARSNQPNKQDISRRVCDTLIELPEYRRSHTIMWYLDIGTELRTRQALPAALTSSKRIVIPYCENKELHLWVLHSLDELVPGKFGILEPPMDRWQDHARSVDIAELDLIVIPGLGFDHRGHRLGHGQGYYDRLLARAIPHTFFVGLCYQSQVFDEIPVGPQDVNMHMLITEKQIYTF
jgi:5-formyltetrahydrofolate cyclo-ligase